MKKLGFIIETDQGDSLAYSVIATDKLSEKERWAIGLIEGFEQIPMGGKVIRLELEFEEVLA